MRTVWKYDLHVGGDPRIAMPVGARILHVDDQDGDPDTVQLWAEVDTNAVVRHRNLYIVATGSPVFAGTEYVGSVLTSDEDQRLVWHVYDDGYADE
jgi:hypothetical protein